VTLLTTPARDTGRRPPAPSGTEPLGSALGFAVAALSFGAAAIHFSAVREHWQQWALAGLFFAVVGVLQVAWGAAVLHRPNRLLLALGAAAQLQVVVVWIVSRTSGMPFGPQAHVAEPVGTADVVCSVLEVLAAIGAASLLRPGLARRFVPRAQAVTIAGVAAMVAAIATSLALLPATGGGHSHVRVRGDIPTGWTAGCSHHSGGGHAAGACTDAPVTPEQRSAAERLVADTRAAVIDTYPTLQAAEADGYQLLNVDQFVVHVQRPDYQHDGRVLDPNRVESLVYVTYKGRSMLMGAMFIAEPEAPQGPLIGGALTSWHIHTNLCVDDARGTALDAGAHGTCPPGSAIKPTAQMLHVWTRSYPGGPFADLTQAGADRAEKALKKMVDG
jgi:hypothetical protein